MNWAKFGTFAAAAAAGILAIIFPTTASILTPIATGLAGLAIKHPADILIQDQTSNQLTNALSALQSAQKAQSLK